MWIGHPSDWIPDRSTWMGRASMWIAHPSNWIRHASNLMDRQFQPASGFSPGNCPETGNEVSIAVIKQDKPAVPRRKSSAAKWPG